MLTIFEGARGSGKSFLANYYSNMSGHRKFRYDFGEWFSGLGLINDDERAHLFALGKESMLLQLNRDGIIKDNLVIDRGIISVFSWGVLTERISEDEAMLQLKLVCDMNLLDNCRIIHVSGQNPVAGAIARAKDNWDSWDGNQKEIELSEKFRDILANHPYNIETHLIQNTFDTKVLTQFEKLF